MSSNDAEIFDIRKMEEKNTQLQTLIDEFGNIFDEMKENFMSQINKSQNSALYGVYGERLIATYEANIPDLNAFKNNFDMWVQFINIAEKHDLNLLDETESLYQSGERSTSNQTNRNSSSTTFYENTGSEEANGSSNGETVRRSSGIPSGSSGENKFISDVGKFAYGDETRDYSAQNDKNVTDSELDIQHKKGQNHIRNASGGKEFLKYEGDIVANEHQTSSNGKTTGQNHIMHSFGDKEFVKYNSEEGVIIRNPIDESEVLNENNVINDSQVGELDSNETSFLNKGIADYDIKNLSTTFMQKREEELRKSYEKFQTMQANGESFLNPEKISTQYMEQHMEQLQNNFKNGALKPLEPLNGPIPYQPDQTRIVSFSEIPSVEGDNVFMNNSNLIDKNTSNIVVNPVEDYKDIIYRA